MGGPGHGRLPAEPVLGLPGVPGFSTHALCLLCIGSHLSHMHPLRQAVGVLASAYPSGWLVGKFGAQPVLCLMALFPLLMCATSGLIREERQDSATRFWGRGGRGRHAGIFRALYATAECGDLRGVESGRAAQGPESGGWRQQAQPGAQGGEAAGLLAARRAGQPQGSGNT